MCQMRSIQSDLSGRSGHGHHVLICAEHRRPHPLLCPAVYIFLDAVTRAHGGSLPLEARLSLYKRTNIEAVGCRLICPLCPYNRTNMKQLAASPNDVSLSLLSLHIHCLIACLLVVVGRFRPQRCTAGVSVLRSTMATKMTAETEV